MLEKEEESIPELHYVYIPKANHSLMYIKYIDEDIFNSVVEYMNDTDKKNTFVSNLNIISDNPFIALEDVDIGIQGLLSIPVGASTSDIGESDLAINFAGVTFLPDDHIYADNTGVILSPEPLDIE